MGDLETKINNATEFTIKQIKKRTGEVVSFDITKISSAIYRAMEAAKEEGINLQNDSIRIAQNVVKDLQDKIVKKNGETGGDYVPEIEEIQNLVERNLIISGLADTAKAYILYRNRRAQVRVSKRDIPERVKKLVNDNKKLRRKKFHIYYVPVKDDKKNEQRILW